MTTSTAPVGAQNPHAPEPAAAGPGTHTDPAARLTRGAIPVQVRSARPHSFDPADFGPPSGREVNWMHTPLTGLGALFQPAGRNDGVSVAVSAPQYLASGLPIGTAPRGEFFRPEDVVSAVAWQGDASALHLRIPREEEVAEPIVVTITGQGSADEGADVAPRRADAHLVIEAEPHSQATIVLRHEGSAQYAQNVEILVRDGARLTVISVQNWADDALHLAAHQARVERSASLKHVVVSFGGAMVRVNPTLELAGAGAEGRMYGLSFADAGQHLESQVYLHHRGPHTTGDVLYKGALQGKGARSVWVGDVLIGPEAVGTDSYEANRNLVLTEGARADSIPNLEIETGDIVGAGHASATGRFDDEQLFYLQSRGIPEEEARRLVVLGFLSDIVQRLEIPSLEEELTGLILAELAEVSA